MASSSSRELIHKVNNFLAVVYTQVAVGKAGGSLEAAHQALDYIQRAAEDAAVVVKQAVKEQREQEAGS